MATVEVSDKKKYKKESFLEVLTENYYDYIKNMVYKYQMYDTILNEKTFALYQNPSMMKTLDDDVIEMISFLRKESENIYRMKGIAFVKECRDLVTSKYKMLRSSLLASGANAQYYFNQEAFQFFKDHISQINWGAISNDVYCNGYIIEEPFNVLMDEIFLAYTSHKFSEAVTTYYCEPLIVVIDKSFGELIEVLNKLKSLSEESRSSHITTIISREALDLLIMVYSAIKTIQPYE